MRLVIARCEVDYTGRLAAHLAMAVRLIMIKADGSVSVHADDRAYKPLNWMSAPCTLTVAAPPADRESDLIAVWQVHNPAGEKLRILIAELLSDQTFQLGTEPGLVKDGVEAHLQELLAEHPQALGEGWTTVRREHPTAIGPVDLLCRDAEGVYVAVEVKRKGEIAGVEQLSRYLDLLNRDPLLGQVRGVIAAQVIRAQARVVADDRGIGCVLVDYDSLRGIDDPESRLF